MKTFVMTDIKLRWAYDAAAEVRSSAWGMVEVGPEEFELLSEWADLDQQERLDIVLVGMRARTAKEGEV